jgi:ligand-binding sensor domain-containing protein
MIKKLILSAIAVLFSVYNAAQDLSGLWQGHYSYLNIKDVVEGNNKIYAASENAIFIYDIQTQELNTVSTIEGLSGEIISTIHYSEAFNQIIIGYENGLIELFFENDGQTLSVIDILQKQTIPPDTKRINHFNEYDGVVYISTDFGISVYDLERLEFGDTYFIGDGGTQIIVNQTAIFEDKIYAACASNSGIKAAPVSSNNLIDYQEWISISQGNFNGIETFGSKLFTTRFNNTIYEISNDILINLFTFSGRVLDLKSSDADLVVTLQDQVFIYDSNFIIVANPTMNPEFDSKFTSAVTTNEGIYIGTEEYGILRTTINSPSSFTEVHPDGPLLNSAFSLGVYPNNVWVTFGEYDLFFNPYPLNSRGYSQLNTDGWINTPFDDVFGAVCLNSIAINPLNHNQVFISSFFSGLLQIDDNLPTVLYDETNSGLESLIIPSNPNYVDIRVGPAVFDQNSLLWTITSRIDSPLKSYNPSNNQWRSFSFTSLIPNGLEDNLGFGDLVIDADGTKWIASYDFGLIGYQDNGGNAIIKNIVDDSQGNLPDLYVKSLAVDNRNQLWIGTIQGLRVLYNPASLFTDDGAGTEQIIILEDGIPKELLESQFISDIKVDGANNKWVATIGAGLFYFSPNGQNTIYHFTKDNSPLPSNNINDLGIDNENGLVYIATDRGLLSFSSGSSLPQENLSNAYIYPNPVRPTFDAAEDKVKIKDISDNVNIKITDIEGNLVAEAQSGINLRHRGYNLEIDGGTAYWDGKNLVNNAVASGVYLVMLSDLDTFETKVLKVMIIR